MSADLDTLFPDQTADVKGEQVTVHPFYFGQISRVSKLCLPIARALIESGLMKIEPGEGNTSTVKVDRNFVPKLFDLMADASEPLLVLIAYACNKPREWLDTVPIDDGIRLTEKLWEVNSNFFVKRVLPILSQKLINSVSIGETLSPASSSPATDETTSIVTP